MKRKASEIPLRKYRFCRGLFTSIRITVRVCRNALVVLPHWVSIELRNKQKKTRELSSLFISRYLPNVDPGPPVVPLNNPFLDRMLVRQEDWEKRGRWEATVLPVRVCPRAVFHLNTVLDIRKYCIPRERMH